jgi:hypothetical protein
VARIDPDLLPQPLPEGWMSGAGRHLGAMVVSLAPEAAEIRFGATEWRLLTDAFCDAAPVEPRDIYFTSVAKVPGGDPAAALSYLVEEVQSVVPRYILALGQGAFAALTGTSLGLALYRGLWQHLDERFDWDEALVLGTHSPADALERRSRRVAFRADVAEFVRAWREGRDG